jgi:hypothetical protein
MTTRQERGDHERQGPSEGISQPVTITTPADTEYDSPAHPNRGQETAQDRADDRPSSGAITDSAERIGLLNDPASLRNEWQQIQGTFVDNPQRAVHEASALVDRTLQEIQENVTREQISDPRSTEDLRVSFQRYREFFQRLLSA